MKRFIIYLVLSSIYIFSCQKILFNEDEKIRELILTDFHAVKFSGVYNIVLIQDSTNRLVVKGKGDINSINAVVIDDTLIIDDHNKRSFSPGNNTLVLHFSNLGYMVTYGAVNVSNEDTIKAHQFLYDAVGEIAEARLVVDCSYFVVVNSANTLGYLHFSGRASDCVFFNRYGSGIFADSLYCKNAEIINESVGDVHINASENIKAFILGPGNIYYHGDPVIEIAEKRSDGRLIRLN